MPGTYYCGAPENILHVVAIYKAILDISATVKPYLGIVGMEGDGLIRGHSCHDGQVAREKPFGVRIFLRMVMNHGVLG